MIIKKAIEILEIETGSRHVPSCPDLHDAINLGIEALKDNQIMRILGLLDKEYLLPSETKE